MVQSSNISVERKLQNFSIDELVITYLYVSNPIEENLTEEIEDLIEKTKTEVRNELLERPKEDLLDYFLGELVELDKEYNDD